MGAMPSDPDAHGTTRLTNRKAVSSRLKTQSKMVRGVGEI